MSRTGERLDAEDGLYGVDLLRHRAAYRFAEPLLTDARVLELGSGTGYGTRSLVDSAARVVAVDRVRPEEGSLRPGAEFLRADLNQLPLRSRSFDRVVSFQVIEHLVDPRPYLASMADSLVAEGVAVVTTPNLTQSDRENPYHVHEYEADELHHLLLEFFEEVEMRGVHAEGEAWTYHENRLRQIRRIVRLDVLGLRRRLPTAFVEWAFAQLSVVVRRLIGASDLAPQLGEEHYPIGPADERCVDLLAVCRRPRRPGCA